ncbi:MULTISPECIES: head maturation protease, ClpP-related [Pacificibacter]|uniref:head maturation protease, ClpP-related n=1 Tax=Pacificibacter TaxID=1042323 RepID=UPI001C099627|nr:MULTISPECIES: head maturation protease, ClpP-related [Pacificibacter]MBU2936987.1 ATP-dependent Clp protease proteolytic subunit [Pacificibacter marinus]MDO6617163.1 ATP-dependent Clp protease proteolytic subunit [Pacificibacter sp. 1_MG-2023]
MTNEIYLYGTVGNSFFGDEDFFTAQSVRDALEGRGGPLTVRLNSGGGVASEGQAIYQMLSDYPDTVEIVVDGVAASAASLIAMAGDTIVMPTGAILMIHDPASPWVEGRGTEQDHLNAAKGLSVISTAYAKVYAARANISVEEARDYMRAETFFDGDAALEAGFVTHTDLETQAAAVARFDYRVYANAPQVLRVAGGAFPAQQSREAVMAMMAGFPAPNLKESTMPNDNDQTDDQTETPEDDAVALNDDVEASAGDDADANGENQSDDSTPVAVQILDICAATNRPDAEARDYINRGLTLAQAVAEITSNRSKESPVTSRRNGGPTARIIRDERTTRRTGMMQAITAQITGAGTVASIARPFMDMSLVEMAAQCIDHRGPMRNSGQKLQVFADASHSTSDFPGIFENALNKVLLERYQLSEPTFKQISRKRNFSDFREHPQVRAGDFPKLRPIGENGEIKYGSFGESRETAVLNSYGVALRISRQMMINDELGAIDELLSDYGQSVADFEEETFYAFALSAKLSDGKTVFHADHDNIGTAAAITVASVGAGRAAMRKQMSIDKKKLNLSPSIILVGPDKETEAEQLVATIQPQEAGNVNPFTGRLTPIVSAQITGNAWHLLAGADRPGGSCWVHGYLEGAEAPRVRTEEAFGQQGMAMSLEHDFGMGAVDYRGGYKNPGA